MPPEAVLPKQISPPKRNVRDGLKIALWPAKPVGPEGWDEQVVGVKNDIVQVLRLRLMVIDIDQYNAWTGCKLPWGLNENHSPEQIHVGWQQHCKDVASNRP